MCRYQGVDSRMMNYCRTLPLGFDENWLEMTLDLSVNEILTTPALNRDVGDTVVLR
jgi:hypothetical protein